MTHLISTTRSTKPTSTQSTSTQISTAKNLYQQQVAVLTLPSLALSSLPLQTEPLLNTSKQRTASKQALEKYHYRLERRKKRQQQINANKAEYLAAPSEPALTEKKLNIRPLNIIASLSLALTASALTLSNNALAASVFINEFHYDNSGADVAEGLEIAAIAGTDLSDWQLLFYNGGDGKVYKNSLLSGVIANQNNGYGVLDFSISGIQNGPADAFALVDSLGTVVDFISYEGSVLATDGAATGLNSTDVGLTEPTNTALGFSLQRFGSGNDRDDFTWILDLASFGDINNNQSFTSVSAVPLPASFWLFSTACLGLCSRRALTKKTVANGKINSL